MKPQYKPRQIRKVGSSTIEPIELTDYVIVQKKGKQVLLRDVTLNKKELWIESSGSGYLIQIGKKTYEFVSSSHTKID